MKDVVAGLQKNQWLAPFCSFEHTASAVLHPSDPSTQTLDFLGLDLVTVSPGLSFTILRERSLHLLLAWHKRKTASTDFDALVLRASTIASGMLLGGVFDFDWLGAALAVLGSTMRVLAPRLTPVTMEKVEDLFLADD